MRARLSRFRPRPGVVIPAIALFFAIGGIGYAASKIGTDDIKNGAVTKKKLHKNAVVSKKVKDHSLKKKDLAFNAATGATGPRGPTGASGLATTDASTVNGLSVQKVFFKGGPNTTVADQFSAAGLVLRLGCTSGDPVAEVVVPNRNDISLQGDVSGINNPNGDQYTVSSGLFTVGFDITGGNTGGSGRLTYATSTGTVLTMLYGFDNSPTFGSNPGEDVCTFRATVIVG